MPDKMRLSEAIRLGAMMGPQLDGVLHDPTTNGSCVVGAAMLAGGFIQYSSNQEWLVPGWFKEYGLGTSAVCPVCGLRAQLVGILVHLNNFFNNFGGHGWTRERIARWVEEEIEAKRSLPQERSLVVVG